MLQLMVSGDGHGGQPFGNQPFSLRPSEFGCQLPMAEWPSTELPMPMPVTRYPKMISPANSPVSGLRLGWVSHPPPATWGCRPPPENCKV